MQKKQWLLWVAIVVLLVASLPGLASRFNAEVSNNHYEIILPYEEIQLVERQTDATMEELLQTLKDAGLTTVALSPFTLDSLEESNAIHIYEENELAAQLQFTPYRNSVDVDKTGYYFTQPEDAGVRALIERYVRPEVVEVAEEPFYFLGDDAEYDVKTPIGYDEAAISLLEASGLRFVYRVENAPSEGVNHSIVKQLLANKSDLSSGVLGSGEEVLGFGQKPMKTWTYDLHDAGYFFYTVEANPQRGEYAMAKLTDYAFVRLISMNVNRETSLKVSTAVDRAVRAVKERNIKSVFFHLKQTGDAEENLDEALSFLEGVRSKMPAMYPAGEVTVFEPVTVPTWAMGLALLAGVLFMYACLELVRNRWVQVLGAAGMAVLAAGFVLLDRVIFVQAFALLVACVTPIYAVVRSANGARGIGRLAIEYGRAVGISAVGITIVLSVLNGNGFISGFEQFRGVKLVYVVPIAGALVFALLMFSRLAENGAKRALLDSVKLFNKEVRYWHLAVLAVVAVIGLFYISRSGNYGAVSGTELAFRQWLENVLYIRPRTKEFLIGFPLFVLALYVMSMSRRWGSLLLVPGVIGWLSIVNTFTHLHIPIWVSLLRTAYSLVLGFVIGLVFIALFKVALRVVQKLSARWS